MFSVNNNNQLKSYEFSDKKDFDAFLAFKEFGKYYTHNIEELTVTPDPISNLFEVESPMVGPLLLLMYINIAGVYGCHAEIGRNGELDHGRMKEVVRSHQAREKLSDASSPSLYSVKNTVDAKLPGNAVQAMNQVV